MRKLLLLAALCLPLGAQTAINDTLYLQDSAPWTGVITVSWPAFSNCSGTAIAAGSRDYAITNGVVSITLYPTDCASPSFSYGARYRTSVGTNRGVSWSETWAIPSTPSIVTLRAVRQSSTFVIQPGQIMSGGATSGQCLAWSGTAWAPAVCGTGGGAVSSVAGRTGDVVLAQSDITGLVAALAGKAASTHAHAESDVTGLVSDLSGKVPTTRTVNGHALSADVSVTKGDVGLGSVDNTADSAKPISTATQSALDLKAPLASPTFTGTVTIGSTVLRGGGTALPGTCSIGDQYFLTTGTTGNYQCTAINTWTLPGGGAGAAPYTCTVSAVSSIACTHNLGTSTPWVACYDGAGRMLGSTGAATSVMDVTATSANVATINFSGSTTGTCVISTGSMGPKGDTGATGATGPQGPAGTGSTVANGTASMGTSSIGSGACASVVTVTATGVATTDVLTVSFNGDPTGVTGYVPATTGMLTIIPYPTANAANFKVCNNTGSSITPGALTLNWRVAR